MILVLDTETTGIPIKDLPLDHPNQPYLVQLGLIQVDDNWKETGCVSLIIRPDPEITVPDFLTRVHRITVEQATSVGVPSLIALAIYTNLRATANTIVAHNAEFDIKIMDIAIIRSGRTPAHPGPSTIICTADLATPILNLPPSERMLAVGLNQPKRPSLKECYQHFFGEDLPGAHNAINDARACLKIYQKLVNL